MPIVPAQRRAEVGEDVAEEIGADDDVEPVRVLHEMGGQDVDVILVGAHGRIARRHRFHAFVPVRHRDRDAVRLGRRGQMLFRPAVSQLVRVAQHAIDAASREDRLLDDDFVVGALVEAAADDEYSPSVFSRTIEKSMSPGARPASGEVMPGIKRTGRKFDVLLKAPPDRDQQSPERNVIGNARKPDRAQKDRIVIADALEPVLGHHRAGRGEALAAPSERLPLEAQAASLCGRVDDADSLRHDFLADAVPGDHRDLVAFHYQSPIRSSSTSPSKATVPGARIAATSGTPSKRIRAECRCATSMPRS